MTTRFIDKSWNDAFGQAIRSTKHEVLLMAPFIQGPTVRALLGRKNLAIRVITRFSLTDFYEGVSSLDALEFLLQRGAEVKGIRHLHSKVYVFDGARAFVTSANLTQAALNTNHEFGADTDNTELVASAVGYFEGLWDRAGAVLTAKQLGDWKKTIREKHQQHHGRADRMRLPDYGTKLGFRPPPSRQLSRRRPRAKGAPQFFVKFFGEGDKRLAHDHPVLDEIDRSQCHWACTYPKNKRPRSVQDGAIMYMGRLVHSPNDTLIYGKAIGGAYRDGDDDASPADIAQRGWKEKWPHYIRVQEPEFVAGVLKNGVSLNELMDTFGSGAFASTERNAAAGSGNTNPRRAFRQQAAVELTPEAAKWLDRRLDRAFAQHGKVTDDELVYP